MQEQQSETDRQNTEDLRTMVKILIMNSNKAQLVRVERAFLEEPDEPHRRSSLDKKIANRQWMQNWLKHFRRGELPKADELRVIRLAKGIIARSVN
jgi:hypothetical protein